MAKTILFGGQIRITRARLKETPMNTRFLPALLLGGLSLTGCDALKDAIDALGITVDVTGTLVVNGDEPTNRTVTLYSPSDNPAAFDTSVCPMVEGEVAPGCSGRVDTSKLTTPVETGATQWSGDNFTVKSATISSDGGFIASLSGDGGATCSTGFAGINNTTKIVDASSMITIEIDGAETDISTFALPDTVTIRCDAPIEEPVVEEPDVPEVPDAGEDITGDGDGWTSFSISDGTATADASNAALAFADHDIDCGGDTVIAPVLNLEAMCDGCGDVAYIRTQFGYGDDAIFTTDATPVAADGSVSATISLPGGYAVVGLDSDADLDGVGESYTITFCEPEDKPAQEIWIATSWDLDDSDIDTWTVNNVTGESVGWSSSSSSWGSLDVDDTNGHGPENIKSFPEYVGGEYEVKIHYWSDHGNGNTNTTVRVVYVDPDTDEVCDVTVTQEMVDTSETEWWTVGMFGPGLACPN
jgi:hypothetical protein